MDVDSKRSHTAREVGSTYQPLIRQSLLHMSIAISAGMSSNLRGYASRKIVLSAMHREYGSQAIRLHAGGSRHVRGFGATRRRGCQERGAPDLRLIVFPPLERWGTHQENLKRRNPRRALGEQSIWPLDELQEIAILPANPVARRSHPSAPTSVRPGNPTPEGHRLIIILRLPLPHEQSQRMFRWISFALSPGPVFYRRS